MPTETFAQYKIFLDGTLVATQKREYQAYF